MGVFLEIKGFVTQYVFHSISLTIFFEILAVVFTWAFLHYFVFRKYLRRIREVTDFNNMLKQLTSQKEILIAYARELCHKNTEIRCAAIMHSEHGAISYAIGIQIPDKKISLPVSFMNECLKLKQPTLLDSKYTNQIKKKIDVNCKGIFVVPIQSLGNTTKDKINQNKTIILFFLSGRRLYTLSKVLHDILFGLTESRLREISLERGYKRATTSINAIEESFEKLIEYSPSGMIILDTRLRILYANLRACQLFVKQKTDMINQQFLKLFPEEKHQELLDIVDKIQEGSPIEAIAKFQYIHGLSQSYFDIFCYPIYGSRKEIVQFIFTIRDTTKNVELERELKRTQAQATKELENKVAIATKELVTANKELEHLNELKSEFVSTISHELRTPLTSIKGYVSLLSSQKLGELTQKQQKALEIVRGESDRLVELINDILDLSRLESGKTTLQLEKVNLGDLLTKVITTFKPQTDERNQKILFKKKDIIAHIDERKMQQIFLNLLSNASKFSEKGSAITITLTEESYATIVQISDKGMGIASDELPHIFDAFHRTAQATENAIKGTGLGLTIVKHLIDLHKGTITCQSKLGKGTTFTIILPKETTQ